MELDNIADDLADQELLESSTFSNITMTTSNYSTNQPTALYNATLEAILVPCLFTVILLVGVVGNTLLILSFARHKTLSTPHNALVVNLASGDFIFLIVSLPFNTIWYTLAYWPFGLVICKLSHFAESLATTVVISTLSILSVERCLIVTGKKLWRQQKRGPIWLTATIWIISLLVSLPSLVSANIVGRVIRNETYTFCFHYDDRWGEIYSKAHVVFMVIFLFCLPLLVIGTAYILIAVHLLLRAFPLSQRKLPVNKAKKNTSSRCWFLRKDGKNGIPEDSRNKDVPKQANNSVDGQKEDPPTCKTGQDDIPPMQQETKSRSTPGMGDNKSCSPDSFTEMTELQQTPVLPYSFVYTGPIPVEVLPKQEENCSKLNTIASIMKEKKDASSVNPPSAPTGSPTAWKETTPLNPSSSNDAKGGYRIRQQSLVTKRRRLALTVLMLIIAFAVCWIPRHIYLLWYHFLPDNFDTFWHVFKIIGFCLSSSNSAVNPVVFYILDTTYRSFVHRAICMICMRTCRSKTNSDGEAVITLGERDYNATIAMTDMKSKGHLTEL